MPISTKRLKRLFNIAWHYRADVLVLIPLVIFSVYLVFRVRPAFTQGEVRLQRTVELPPDEATHFLRSGDLLTAKGEIISPKGTRSKAFRLADDEEIIACDDWWGLLGAVTNSSRILTKAKNQQSRVAFEGLSRQITDIEFYLSRYLLIADGEVCSMTPAVTSTRASGGRMQFGQRLTGWLHEIRNARCIKTAHGKLLVLTKEKGLVCYDPNRRDPRPIGDRNFADFAVSRNGAIVVAWVDRSVSVFFLTYSREQRYRFLKVKEIACSRPVRACAVTTGFLAVATDKSIQGYQMSTFVPRWALELDSPVRAIGVNGSDAELTRLGQGNWYHLYTVDERNRYNTYEIVDRYSASGWQAFFGKNQYVGCSAPRFTWGEPQSQLSRCCERGLSVTFLLLGTLKGTLYCVVTALLGAFFVHWTFRHCSHSRAANAIDHVLRFLGLVPIAAALLLFLHLGLWLVDLKSLSLFGAAVKTMLPTILIMGVILLPVAYSGMSRARSWRGVLSAVLRCVALAVWVCAIGPIPESEGTLTISSSPMVSFPSVTQFLAKLSFMDWDTSETMALWTAALVLSCITILCLIAALCVEYKTQKHYISDRASSS